MLSDWIVAFGDELEEELGCLFGEGEMAEFIELC
jgi:hypothetical protein